MKIDRNLIDNNLPQEKIAAFRKYLFENIHLKKPTGFNKFITSIWGYVLGFSLLGIGILMLVLGIVQIHSNIPSITGLIFVVFSGVNFYILLKIRRKIINTSVADLNFLDISRKWFANYDLENEAVNNYQSQEMRLLISKYRRSPSDATIITMTNPISIKVKNITSTFFVVKWHWVRTHTDSKGRTTRTNHYLDQIYMFDYGLSKKWNKFEFSLVKGKSIFKNKKESLENMAFNKTFKYSYNDGVKLRMAFTPSIQESLLNKFKWRNISIHKAGDFVVTTCENKHISHDFSPFTFDLGMTRLNEEDIKRKIAKDLITDFKLLMTFMGHTRIMYTMYEK